MDPAALASLRQRAHALAAEPMASGARFAALEAIRAQAVAASEARRALYCDKPVPFADGERQAWEDAVALWQAFYFAYALCADAGQETARAAAISQRALDSLGRAIREHGYAYRAIPASIWKEFHACFRSADECALAEIEVADPLEREGTTTCKRSYLATVLHDCAYPYALTAPQIQTLERLLPHWLRLADVNAAEPVWASRSPLALDLAGESGARLAREVGSGDAVRYLDTSALGMRLRELADCLRNGEPATELEALGDMPRAQLERLLTHLYVQWCSAGAALAEDRHAQALRAQVALGMHAVHFQISGRAFRQPGLRYTREEEHDLATFGHITERTEQRLLTGRSAAMEPWEVVSRGAAALSLRRKPDLLSRIAHGQLLAIRTSSIDPPSLGVVQRLRIEANGETSVGVKLVRAEARGAAVRDAGDNARKYERALVLDPEPQRSIPATLIVTARRFAPGARIELHTGRAETVSAGPCIESGFDFDRIAYST